MARQRQPDVPYTPPTKEEEAAGAVFTCRICERPWPTRLAHRYEFLCITCGRGIRREREQARRLRARGIEAPTPSIGPHKETNEVAGKKMSAADVQADRVATQEVDRIVEQATKKRPPKKQSTGLVKR